MKTLKQMTNRELTQAPHVGVHTAKEMIRRGLAVRCALGESDWIVPRAGLRQPYGIKRISCD